MSINSSDWRSYAYLAGGSVVTLSEGLSEDEARDFLAKASKFLADRDSHGASGTIGGTRGAVSLAALEAVSIKDFRAVGR